MSVEARGPTGTVIRDYKDLQVWQKAMELAINVFRLTRDFPSDGKFGLVPQMRRAAVSVASNLAEGQARNTPGSFVQFISHAEGSLAELDTQLRLAVALGFCKWSYAKAVGSQLIKMQKMLKGLRRKLNTNHYSPGGGS
jgi:four helix bundle protein